MVSADEPLAGRRRRRAARAGHARGRPDARGRGDRVEQGVRPRAARRSRARGGAARCASCAAPASWTRRSAAFGATPVVVKPSGLTGGKGVKVMGPHLASHDDGARLRARAARPRRRGRLGADRGEGRRRRVHDPGDQRRPHGRVPARRPMTTPIASTATRGRAPAAWARCRCAEPTLPFMTDVALRAGVRDRRAR